MSVERKPVLEVLTLTILHVTISMAQENDINPGGNDMRKCPACEEYVAYDSIICECCGYNDVVWSENLRAHWKPRIVFSHPVTAKAGEVAGSPQRVSSPFEYTVLVSSFIESGEHAYELTLFERACASNKSRAAYARDNPLSQAAMPRLEYDYRPLRHDWDSSIYIDEYNGDVIPATVGVTALIDTRQAIEVATDRYKGVVEIVAILPPDGHPVTHFLESAQLIPGGTKLVRSSKQLAHNALFGALETIVPACTVRNGQLPDSVFERLDTLAAAGQIRQEYKRHLRGAVMELVDNGYRHSNGACTVAVFMRNESPTGTGASIRLPLSANDVRKVHLFVLCYTTGPSLAEKLGTTGEREAVARILARNVSTSVGGGLGLGFGGTLCKARDKAMGTIFVSSGNYTRIDMPNGMIREWTSEAGAVLSGVSICLLVPLANVTALSVPQAS